MATRLPHLALEPAAAVAVVVVAGGADRVLDVLGAQPPRRAARQEARGADGGAIDDIAAAVGSGGSAGGLSCAVSACTAYLRDLSFTYIMRPRSHWVIDTRPGSSPAKIAARVADEGFDSLDAPIKIVACPDTPVPFSPPLEKYYVPDENRIINTVKEIL